MTDYQIALEACRAYKALHIRLRQLGLHTQADEAKAAEDEWRKLYIKLADQQAAQVDVE